MDENQRQGLYAIIATAIVGFLLWMAFRQRQKHIVQNNAPAPNTAFYSPYYQTTPGIADNGAILNGSPQAFQSTVNVYVDNPALGALSRQYIPVFGFVGMTAVGA